MRVTVGLHERIATLASAAGCVAGGQGHALEDDPICFETPGSEWVMGRAAPGSEHLLLMCLK